MGKRETVASIAGAREAYLDLIDDGDGFYSVRVGYVGGRSVEHGCGGRRGMEEAYRSMASAERQHPGYLADLLEAEAD